VSPDVLNSSLKTEKIYSLVALLRTAAIPSRSQLGRINEQLIGLIIIQAQDARHHGDER